MAVTWVTTDDVKLALGIAPADTTDDAWLTQVTAAANDVAYRRRFAAGYVDDKSALPDDAVKQGTVMYAVSLYRERGAVDGFASMSELGTFTPSGGTWGQCLKLWGVSKMAVG